MKREDLAFLVLVGAVGLVVGWVLASFVLPRLVEVVNQMQQVR